MITGISGNDNVWLLCMHYAYELKVKKLEGKVCKEIMQYCSAPKIAFQQPNKDI